MVLAIIDYDVKPGLGRAQRHNFHVLAGVEFGQANAFGMQLSLHGMRRQEQREEYYKLGFHKQQLFLYKENPNLRTKIRFNAGLTHLTPS
jgi:hypothetical protein